MNLPAEASTATAAAEAQGPTVLQVLPAMRSGGVERGAVEIAGGLARAGWRPLVASAGGPMARELERFGARHFALPLEGKFPLTLTRNARRLAALIEAEGVDLVHARSRAPAWSALFAARRKKKPFVTTFHSPYGENAVKHWWNAVMAKGDRVIAISDWLAEHVRRHFRVGDDRLVTIPRGVDLTLFDPERARAERMAQLARAWRLPDDAFVVMLPGRLTRWKGQAVLLEALARLGRRDVSASWSATPRAATPTPVSSPSSPRPAASPARCAWSAIAATCRPPTCWPMSPFPLRSSPRASAASPPRPRPWAAR